MSTTLAGPGTGRIPLSPAMAILLAVSLGLAAGYLDVGSVVLGKNCWNKYGYFGNARDFPWTLPAGHAALLLIPGLVLAALVVVVRFGESRPRRPGLLASLSLWGALLKLPLYGACSLMLAVGVGRLIASAVGARCSQPRRLGAAATRCSWASSAVCAGLTTGWQTVRENLCLAGLLLGRHSQRNHALFCRPFRGPGCIPCRVSGLPDGHQPLRKLARHRHTEVPAWRGRGALTRGYVPFPFVLEGRTPAFRISLLLLHRGLGLWAILSIAWVSNTPEMNEVNRLIEDGGFTLFQ